MATKKLKYLVFPPISTIRFSANARMLAEIQWADNRVFTDLPGLLIQKNYGFGNKIVVPGFHSNIRHSNFRQLGLPARECWRKNES